MGRTIEIPESLYRDLEKRAREQGISVVELIASVLPGVSLPTLLEGLVGAIDSTKNPTPAKHETPFGEYVANKLEKQGIRQH